MINVKLEKLDKNKFYPLGDVLTLADIKKLGLLVQDMIPRGGGKIKPLRMSGKKCHIMAKPTGKKRYPKKGEWLLSGTIIEAYRAPNDIAKQYHIAELVIVEKIEVIREVKSTK